MHNIALSWQQAAGLAAGLAALYGALRWSGRPLLRRAAPFARESFVIAVLYSLWQLAGELSVTGTSGAYARGRWIAHFEHDIRLPSEASVQRLVTGNSVITQGANLYYASMHFGVLFVFLVWLFARHRERYAPVRTTLALTTLVCLLIQLLPVAPPRLVTGFGFVDTAAQYNQSVYSLGFGADALSAMPSVHIAWAVLVAWYAARIGGGPWRWLGTVHAAVTTFVVVCTANHWWLDGIVAVAVLVACAWARHGAARLIDAARHRFAPVRTPGPEVVTHAAEPSVPG